MSQLSIFPVSLRPPYPDASIQRPFQLLRQHQVLPQLMPQVLLQQLLLQHQGQMTAMALSGPLGSIDGDQEILVPPKLSVDGQVGGEALQAQQKDQLCDQVQDKGVDQVQLKDHHQLLAP